MIILLVIIAVVVLVVWLPAHYGISGDRNLPPTPPPDYTIDLWSEVPPNDPRNQR